ncbi:nitric oxide synthase oxygenase [Streptomyces sp. AcH 505]|uniref:nitric oxide synthase oxygenase n=1 Tax=Streptomyces sp. AcH 505 TaxID=352211 RepID=UPI0006936751
MTDLTAADAVTDAAAYAEAAAFLLGADWLTDSERTVRTVAVRAELRATGSYRHTPEELAHGAKAAWRNHARCVGRLHWKALRVVDRRHVTSAEEVFDACVGHLRAASADGRLQPVITVFPQRAPDGSAIRIWNPQLIRYAGYRDADGSVTGDPLHVELTDMAGSLGWQGRGGRFDVLPLIVQMPGEEPRWFELPSDAVLEVPLAHPEFDWFAELDLRWHAVPAISDMRMEIGGIDYPACPFSGWYVGYEIGARNLADTDRYDLLPLVAAHMAIDTSYDSTLWKDRALVELNRAVLHSFQQAGVHLVDHHTVTRQFVTHEDRERRKGYPVSADKHWIVPPLSASTTPVFHRAYETIEARPNFFRQPAAWR